MESAEKAALEAELAAKTGLAKIEAALTEAERAEDLARDRTIQVIEQEAEALMQEVAAKKKEVLAMQAEGVSDKAKRLADRQEREALNAEDEATVAAQKVQLSDGYIMLVERAN